VVSERIQRDHTNKLSVPRRFIHIIEGHAKQFKWLLEEMPMHMLRCKSIL
jgi:hypothetical protein